MNSALDLLVSLVCKAIAETVASTFLAVVEFSDQNTLVVFELFSLCDVARQTLDAQ